MINLTTGPISLDKPVYQALISEPISHRSVEFQTMHQEVVNKLCEQLQAKQTFILQGSGTLANEAMLWQIKMLKSKGIILSNGEFGNRLIKQSKKIGLNYLKHKTSWGNEFCLGTIETLIQTHNLKWILFCHCETSTGVVNNIKAIASISQKYNCKVFVDCMSTIGTIQIDLSNISMATGSSGKGLCSLSGIALVFSNINIAKSSKIPRYLDLFYYKSKKGIPFTLSSNQLKALSISIQQTMNTDYWNQKDAYARKVHDALYSLGVIPFATKSSRVFTIIQKKINSQDLSSHLNKIGLSLSYQSKYLLKRNWLQLTLFGNHNYDQIDFAVSSLKKEISQAISS
ncbi:aminotransferase class V-fold PLP-dependent enzyme [Pseudotenacibaculum haliotis]|uniref:Aminotransferase class V-fold PLP-dependent enzyme n=1 Tax=Pseudotenacibaculum haliotis TaxID=1862138 RepID=A0ABW5LTQ8_9FLAO